MSVPDSLLNRIAGTAAVATKSEVAIITVTDRQDNIIRVVGGHNINVRGITGSIIHVDAESFCGVVTSTGQYAVTRNLAQLPTPVRTPMECCGVKTVLAVPVKNETNGTTSGVLFLGSRRFSNEHQAAETAQAIALLVGQSYDNERLLFELIHEVHDLKWLASITDRIRLEDSHDQVVGAVLESGCEVLDADAVILFTLNDDSPKLKLAASHGLPSSIIRADNTTQHRLLLDTLDMVDPLVIQDTQQLSESDPWKEMVLDVTVRSILVVQLRHHGSPIGLLLVLYKRPGAAGERKTELCRLLAADAAVALNYSRVLDQSRALIHELETVNARLEQQAVQDGLTGLANHRAFHQRLTEFVHRVGRYGESFSVAMLDVDHFKAYNDAYGHQEGDLALQQIARMISEEIRESDIAARYGGEEFAVILPHTPKSHGRIALERIRKAIDNFQFPNGKLTISGGIAECPVDGVTPNEVLEKADRALYHAKLTGRNRVCLWAASPDDQTKTETVGDGKNVSVLVVEYDQDARAALEHALKQAGYDLHRASTTNEAIDLLRSRKFDIMLSDALILGTDGMQILGLASSIHPMMPIVLTTVPSMAGVARQAMQHGVTDLLVKPFNELELPVVIERNLERKRLERQMLLEKSTGILLQAIDALVAAIDAKDRLTAGHTAKVTHIALAIADTLGLPSEERYTLELAARLHDIGKLSLPDSALNKPGALSDEEWAAMQRHPAVGSQIVGAIEELSYIATIVRHHHERLDGKGYPDGLQGEAIPFLSRIIAVADAFEAMTSERSYRQRMTPQEAIEELRRCVGTHYSSDIVEALVESLRLGALEDKLFSQAA